MSRHSYRLKFQHSGTDAAQRDELSLLRLLEDLNLAEWDDFLSDLILDDPSSYDVLGLPKGERILPYSVTYLNRLGRTPRRLISKAIERIIGNGISSQSDPRIEGALFIASTILEEPLLSYLVNLIQQDRVSDALKTAIASVLSSHPESPPPTFWANIDLTRYPFLAPMCIAAVGPTSPDVALRMLGRLKLTAESLYALEYPLRVTLRALFKRRTRAKDFSQLWARSAPETKGLLRTVSGLSEFDLFRHEISRVIEMPEQEVLYLKGIYDSKRLDEELNVLAEGAPR